ncbi:hypothetical protein VNO80_00631 [Phaseolus coccineus]|uniref:Uncharacterized protein n=1 Tax=Phaseolus coccineus TaxID=3886 RepID=A0AAN9NZM1_PHACN
MQGLVSLLAGGKANQTLHVRLLCCETSVIGNINNCINTAIFYQEDTYIIILEHKTECSKNLELKTESWYHIIRLQAAEISTHNTVYVTKQ